MPAPIRPSSTSGPPPAAGADLTRALAVAASRAQFGEVPAPADRQAFATRLATIQASLDHRDKKTIASAITDLAIGMKSRSGGEGDTKEIVRVYGTALMAYPTWAVVDACQRVQRGTAGLSPTYLPSVAELVQLCEGAVAALHAERAKLSAVLSARPRQTAVDPGPDTRDRVAAILARTKASLDATAAEQRGHTRPKPDTRPPWEQMGITREQFDALPDQPSPFRRVGE